MTTLDLADDKAQNAHVVWQSFPSWAQFSWLYLLSAVSALRGAMVFRFDVEGWELWMIGASLLLVCAAILRRWAHYELHRERLVVRNGYTGSEIQSVPLTEVRAVVVQQGVVAEFFGIGTVAVSSASPDRSVSVRGVREPEDVKIRIQAAAWRQTRAMDGPRAG